MQERDFTRRNVVTNGAGAWPARWPRLRGVGNFAAAAGTRAVVGAAIVVVVAVCVGVWVMARPAKGHGDAFAPAVRSELTLPVAIRLTSPPTAREPIDGEGNTADKHRIFPHRLWASVEGDSDSQDGLEALLRQRLRQKT